VSAGEAARRGDGTADTGLPAQTPAERRAQVDGQLDASLGKFDEHLRREQQQVAGERDQRTAGGAQGGGGSPSGPGDGSGDSRDSSGDLKSEGVQGANRAGASGSGEAGAATAGAMPQGGGGSAGTKAIPSGDDDDIIARRLRKAAEAETDPELKEKLWQEYRDYKENTRGGR
jgi:hypothetical protein